MSDSDNNQSGPSANSGETVFKPRSPQQSGDDKTTVQVRQAPISSKPAEPESVNQKTAEPEPVVALTRIRQSIRDQDSSTGFAVAKQAADEALSSDKIIINKRFVLESTLGAGGMGTVYRARDLRKIEAGDLNPYVAVKVLNEDFKNHPDAFVSLQREASRSHTLSHPNIVTVHDFDRDGDVFYMTMELLKGQGLENVLRKHRNEGLPVAEALSIVEGFCLGLIHAHRKNIIHSDLKPGNIFLSEHGAKVLDFGIARITTGAAAPQDFDAGTLGALTPAYASLEMIKGDEPHPSDDVYAAAIIAYELLCGKHPYDRKQADVALSEGLKPARLSVLNKRQWRALEAGLRLTRETRTQSLDTFLSALVERRKFPIFKVTSAILLCTVSVFAYYWFYGPDELTMQADTTYERAQQCLADRDYSCARDSAKAVLEMASEHEAARGLLEQAESSLFVEGVAQHASAIEGCIKAVDLSCAEVALKSFGQFSSEAPEFSVARLKVEELRGTVQREEKMAAARQCIADKNWACARLELGGLLARDTSDEEVSQLLEKVKRGQAREHAEKDRIQKAFDSSMAKAKACQSQKDYVCADRLIAAALKLKPDAAEALVLKQRTQLLQQQDATDRRNADKLVAKGRACLQRKNYTCALTNAESALEFVAEYPEALRLRHSAKEAVNDIKKRISIQ